jgi:hypothetical protein
MKRLVSGLVGASGLLWPVLAYAGEREEKYILLLVGGIIGMLVGAGIYALLLVLAAAFLKRKALVAAVFILCVVIYLRMEYLSFQTLRVALNLVHTQELKPKPIALGPGLQVLLIGILVFAVVIFWVAARLWTKRNRPRIKAPDGEVQDVHY